MTLVGGGELVVVVGVGGALGDVRVGGWAALELLHGGGVVWAGCWFVIFRRFFWC